MSETSGEAPDEQLRAVASPDETPTESENDDMARPRGQAFDIEPAVLRAAKIQVRAAKARARRNEYESELVSLGGLRPDRRLSNGDRDLDAFVLGAARRHFGLE
jgi:hypothetical protein